VNKRTGGGFTSSDAAVSLQHGPLAGINILRPDMLHANQQASRG
jgi:hypothetical protein